MNRGTAPAASVDVESAEGHPRRWWILGILCSSLTLVMVTNSSLNVALPSISRELDASSAQLQWIVDSYALVFSGLLFAAATIGDRFGRKGALQTGLVLFVVCAVAGAMSESATQLVVVRAVMGVGAALVMPSTLSILINVFPAQERPRAISMWAGISAGGAALGPATSGLLLQHFGWASVFLVTLPISIGALVFGHVLVPTSRDPDATGVDVPGVLLSVLGIGTLVYTIIEAPHRGWGSTATIGGFAVAAVVVAVFVRVERATREPMLDVALFDDRRYTIAALGIALAFFGMFGMYFLITLLLQLVHGMSPLGAGLFVLPFSILIMIVSPRAAGLAARYGVRPLVSVSLLIVSFGLVVFGITARFESPYWMWCGLMATAFGMALAMSPMTTLIMASVPRNRAGMGSATNDTTRELGGALGVAVLGSVVSTVYVSRIDTAPLPGPLRQEARSGLAGAMKVADDLGGAEGAALLARATGGFVDGVLVAALVAAAMTLLAAVAAHAWLPRDPLR